jgi:general L-amino acid transport system permease protein
MLQKVRFSFLLLALFALLAPTFAGERSARLRFSGVWVGLIVISHWLITGINTPMTLQIQSPPFLGGFVVTLVIAYYVMLASFPLGILLALARTSKMPIFRVLSTLYIEFIRGIPLITVLFFFSVMLPLFLPGGMRISELAAIFAGYSVFSAAYMAENIRGGLQSIRKGQYEASDALGLSTVQRTSFIILPQALRVSIPNIVGQAIATFKETSLIAIVGSFDLLRVADKSIAAQPQFLGQKRPALLFVCLVYWVFAYSMSRASRNLEVRLGVGQGR